MTTKYRISRNLTADEFITLYSQADGNVRWDVEKIETPDAPKEPRAPRAPRAPEGKISVNGAIKQRLERGYATIGELKDALVGAGKSAASLSTGIAALTKAGEIERTGDGVYSLRAA